MRAAALQHAQSSHPPAAAAARAASPVGGGTLSAVRAPDPRPLFLPPPPPPLVAGTNRCRAHSLCAVGAQLAGSALPARLYSALLAAGEWRACTAGCASPAPAALQTAPFLLGWVRAAACCCRRRRRRRARGWMGPGRWRSSRYGTTSPPPTTACELVVHLSQLLLHALQKCAWLQARSSAAAMRPALLWHRAGAGAACSTHPRRAAAGGGW